MSETMTAPRDVSVCADCIYTAANSWDERETGRPLPDPVPLSLLEASDVLTSDDNEPHFRTSPCQACGQPLAGDRFNATVTTFGKVYGRPS